MAFPLSPIDPPAPRKAWSAVSVAVPVCTMLPPASMAMSAWFSMPPVTELIAEIVLPFASVTLPVALRKIRPFLSAIAELACKLPLLLTIAPTMPMRPLSAMMLPRLVALPVEPVTSTPTPGAAESTNITLLPEASSTLPPGVLMMPLASLTAFPEASKMTRPPSGVVGKGNLLAVVMVALLITSVAVYPGTASNCIRPARKFAFEILSVEATSPATSMVAPAPNTTPLGLMRNTRPLDESVPRISETPPPPVTRFMTLEVTPGWLKRVVSPVPMEKLFQLIIVLGVVVVMVRVLPLVTNGFAAPPTTTPPVGLAMAGVTRPTESAISTAAHKGRRRSCMGARASRSLALRAGSPRSNARARRTLRLRDELPDSTGMFMMPPKGRVHSMHHLVREAHPTTVNVTPTSLAHIWHFLYRSDGLCRCEISHTFCGQVGHPVGHVAKLRDKTLQRTCPS